MDVLISEEKAAEIADRFRRQGPCVAVAGKYSIWIEESHESPGFFNVQQLDGRTIEYTKRPMSCRMLPYIVREYSGLDVEALEFIPCEGLLLDPVTGYFRTDKKETWVYFVQGANGGPIKIGSAVNVERRLRDLQTGSPVVLQVLGAFRGTVAMETWLHGSLKQHCLHGEWFSDCWEVRSVLLELQRRARNS